MLNAKVGPSAAYVSNECDLPGQRGALAATRKARKLSATRQLLPDPPTVPRPANCALTHQLYPDLPTAP